VCAKADSVPSRERAMMDFHSSTALGPRVAGISPSIRGAKDHTS
jgi:hypothetical protein